MKDNLEKSLKRWLKRKISITLAVVTVFAITGSVGFAATAELDGNNTFTGNTTLKATETGNALVKGTLGAGTNGDKFVVDANGNTTVKGTLGAGNTTVKGTLGAGADGDKFTVDAAGNTAVKGTLEVEEKTTLKETETGNTTVKGTLEAEGKTTLKADVDMSSQDKKNTVKIDNNGLNITLEKDSVENVKGNKTSTVETDSTEIVKNIKKEEYGELNTTVTGNSTETVTGGNKKVSVDENHTIENKVENGSSLTMDNEKSVFRKDLYVGSQEVVSKNLQLSDKDAIQIGKAIEIAGVPIANSAEEGGHNIALGYGNGVAGKKGLATGYNNIVEGIEATAIGANNYYENPRN